ncbi:MAG: PKD repeat protein, partial [Flavobacteriales bacterium]
MKKILFLLAFMPFALQAQETSVAAGSYTGCGGFLVDSGLSAADYGANENHTITICAEAPEEVINLYFNLFFLGAGDELSIYDGPDTDSPLIGTYIGFELQAQDVYNSIDNTSGCLTVVFTSDATEMGNFVAEMSCGYPCERPFAIVETSEIEPIRICPGEEISFDSSPSTVAEGFELISWDWDFGDGNTNDTDGSETSHSYEFPGAYKVQLGLTDDNECENNNLADVLILVSTDPDFSGTTEDVEICVGQELPLNGVVTGVIWDGTPNVDLGGELFIPDDQDQCFESGITFTQFLPNAVVESPDDIENFFINFEHSFMGDLTISFICPNGQSIAVHTQGGGGTFLGEPVDNDGTPLAQGVGYDYFWSPDATNGSWADEAGFGTLPSGTYASQQPWTLLEGCPLNGTWTIEICDSWGSDNGFIFDWTINFDPDLFPDPIVFTPIFGQECDSTFWSGPSITETSANCNDVVVQPTEPGTEVYIFSATNNHGCTYEQIVNVIAVQGPIASTTGLEYWCGNPINLTGGIENPEAGTNYTFEWSPADAFSNPNAENPLLQNMDEGTEYTLTVFPAGAPECASSSVVNVQVPEPPVVFDPDEVLSCFGQTVLLVAPNQP